MPPHSLPLCLIGAGLLWTGWFGFNAGSALSASPLAALAFLNTSTAAVDGGRRVGARSSGSHRGKPTALGGATGGGRRAWSRSRPRAGYVSPMGAIAIGIGVTVVCYAALHVLKPALGYDDSLDVFGVHALGGAWGALASGIFAVTLGSGIETNAQQIMVQLKGMAFVDRVRPGRDRRHPVRAQAPSSDRCAWTTRTRSRASTSPQHSESAYGHTSGGSVTLDERGHAAAMHMLAREERLA